MRIESILRRGTQIGNVSEVAKMIQLTLLGIKESKLESNIKLKEIKQDPSKFVKLLKDLSNNSNLSIYKNNLLKKIIDTMEEEVLNDLIEASVKEIEFIGREEAINKIMSTYRYNSKGSIDIPDEITDIMINLSKIKNNQSIINPYNSKCEIQIAIEKYSAKNNIENVQYYAQEMSEELAVIGELISFILGNDSFIKQGNSILGLDFDRKFDCCISVPPFMSRIEDIEIYNKIARDFKYGKLLRSSSWISINPVINNLNEKGRAIILAPLGILFRSGSDEYIRKNLIKEDMVDAIIELPTGILMPYTGVATCILIFNKNKEEHRKGKIQLIDISNYVEKINEEVQLYHKKV